MITPQVVTGEQISVARRTHLVGILLGVVLMIATLGAIALRSWLVEHLGIGMFTLILAGAAGFALGCFLVVTKVRALMVGEWLVLGEQLFQVVSGTTVKQQVPYRNIAAISLKGSKTNGGNPKFVALELRNIQDPETQVGGAEVVEYTRTEFGCDTMISSGYVLPVESIYEKLNARRTPSSSSP